MRQGRATGAEALYDKCGGTGPGLSGSHLHGPTRHPGLTPAHLPNFGRDWRRRGREGPGGKTWGKGRGGGGGGTCSLNLEGCKIKQIGMAFYKQKNTKNVTYWREKTLTCVVT